MSKMSPEARAFFDRGPEKISPHKETPAPAEAPDAPEQISESAELNERKINQARLELLESFEQTTGADPFALVESEDPEKIDQAGSPFFSKFLSKHPKLKRAAMISALLGGLMSTAEPAEAGLREKIQAHLENRENKENHQLRYWKWLRDEIQKACPGGYWKPNKYGGNPTGLYFEIPAGSFRPYANWSTNRVTGDRLPVLGKRAETTYTMDVPPQNISIGEFLLLTTGHLDYVKTENSKQIRLVYCPGDWLSLGEIADQQASLRDGPQEYRLYAHPSKAHPKKPWHTIPILKPQGDTYNEFWTKHLKRPIPEPMKNRR